jgi:hypothetical protein
MATIEDALEILKGTGPEFGRGLSNHGPMAAEALLALGRDEEVVPWVEQYKRQLDVHPVSRSPISRDDWQNALGAISRVGDWISFFDAELTERPWQSVLDEWIVRLAPGLVAAATHGVIRTGHAVRSIAAAETSLRRHELAEGLGFWAARYTRLPERQSGKAGVLSPSQAISHVGLLPAEDKTHVGLLSDRLRPLDDLSEFADVINLVDDQAETSAFVSDMTETFARVYLANVAPTEQPIGLIHAVTSPSAIRLIAPHVSPKGAALLRRYSWQAAAAIYTAIGEVAPGDTDDAPLPRSEDIVDAAVATGDPHAIKFAEACLREYSLNPRPAYMHAAGDAARRLSPA